MVVKSNTNFNLLLQISNCLFPIIPKLDVSLTTLASIIPYFTFSSENNTWDGYNKSIGIQKIKVNLETGRQ